MHGSDGNGMLHVPKEKKQSNFILHLFFSFRFHSAHLFEFRNWNWLKNFSIKSIILFATSTIGQSHTHTMETEINWKIDRENAFEMYWIEYIQKIVSVKLYKFQMKAILFALRYFSFSLRTSFEHVIHQWVESVKRECFGLPKSNKSRITIHQAV